MKAIITKPMCVVGDNKSTIHFKQSTPNNPFVEISNQVYARLKRANAAKPFVESKTTIKPEKVIKQTKPIEKEVVQTSSEPDVEETSLQQIEAPKEQIEAPKASTSSTPPTQKFKS
ncbi:hypothetical protein [Bartonella sp. 1-1C]|uniref:hypothetical protein n=1 Tax=Bartonella sp. 1-1C TaxID=515256 RepID=UPI0001F4C97F|nr:hypothetical protein [Bartonella sp. 1-1C]ATO57156.1 hypothetical protein B11Cv2_003740 [Bartonella sp. 1-1C]CBI80274.1 conserved hypothetical protein [Bartonella sp. 1-1C]